MDAARQVSFREFSLAMERFGLDKPDTRYGMELTDLAEWVPSTGFGVFQSVLDGGGRGMAIAAPGGGQKHSRQAAKRARKGS